MLAASHALKRFDWIVYLSTFLMEEAKHSEFFMRWHDRVVGVLEPEEVAQHFLVRGKTVDPTGRFEVRDVLHEALPYYGRRLMEATMGGVEADIERALVGFSAAYNAFVEGVLTMPSYEIVIDTTTSWDAFPTLRQGFRLILMDEGRHITFGTHACRILIEKDPTYEEEVHRVFDTYRGNIVGLVEYQKAVPGLDLDKYQVMKVRHYRNRCREMGSPRTRRRSSRSSTRRSTSSSASRPDDDDGDRQALDLRRGRLRLRARRSGRGFCDRGRAGTHCGSALSFELEEMIEDVLEDVPVPDRR